VAARGDVVHIRVGTSRLLALRRRPRPLLGALAETLGVLLPGFGVPEQLMGWQGAGHYRPGDVGEALVVLVGVPPQDGERLFHVQPAFLGKHPFGLLERDTGGQHGLQLLGEGGPVGCGFVLHQSNAGDVSQGLAQRQVLGVERPDGRAEQPDSSQGSVLQPQRQGVHAQEPGGARGGDKLGPALCFLFQAGPALANGTAATPPTSGLARAGRL